MQQRLLDRRQDDECARLCRRDFCCFYKRGVYVPLEELSPPPLIEAHARTPCSGVTGDYDVGWTTGGKVRLGEPLHCSLTDLCLMVPPCCVVTACTHAYSHPCCGPVQRANACDLYNDPYNAPPVQDVEDVTPVCCGHYVLLDWIQGGDVLHVQYPLACHHLLLHDVQSLSAMSWTVRDTSLSHEQKQTYFFSQLLVHLHGGRVLGVSPPVQFPTVDLSPEFPACRHADLERLARELSEGPRVQAMQ